MKIYVIAANTFREAVTDRLIFGVLVAGAILIFSSMFIAELAFVQNLKVMTDVGLAVITVTGMVMAVFTGAGLLARETERRRVFSILAKPVPRYQLVVGKYIGTVFAVSVNIGLLTAFLLLFLFALTGTWAVNVFKAVFLIEVEMTVIAAMALFFSTFTSTVLSIFYSVTLFMVCHMTEDIRAYWQIKSVAGRFFFKFIYYVMPNLENFNIKQEAVHNLPVSASHLAGATIYGLLYAAILIVAGVWVFRNRDLE